MRKVDFEKITLTDDMMFSTVLSEPQKCKEFLQRILGITIVELEMVTEQKTMKNKRFGKGIRLDIYVKDQDGNVYDLEMQMTNTKELELRSRYYHSEMDGYQIKAGQPYNELKNSIVIFICDFDMLKRNRSVYTFVNQCVEEKDLILEDKRKTLFVNISGERVGLSEELSVLLDYLKTSEPKDEFTKGLHEEVKSVRKDQEWRENYMTWEMKLDYEYRMGEKAGIEKGIEQGIEQGRVRDIIILLENYAPLPEQLVERIQGITEEEKLTKVLRLAASATSLEDFEEKFAEVE